MKAENYRVRLTIEKTVDAAQTIELIADDKTNLLQLMRDAGLPVRNACRNGGCGICRCQLVSGKIDYRGREPFALWEKEKADGIILPCIAFAKSALILDQLSFDSKTKVDE